MKRTATKGKGHGELQGHLSKIAGESRHEKRATSANRGLLGHDHRHTVGSQGSSVRVLDANEEEFAIEVRRGFQEQ